MVTTRAQSYDTHGEALKYAYSHGRSSITSPVIDCCDCDNSCCPYFDEVSFFDIWWGHMRGHIYRFDPAVKR